MDIQKQNFRNKSGQKGIAVYVAVAVTAALLLVSYAIINIAIKQIGISSSARDSQTAFYASDSGIECALYWDLKNSGQSAFSTTTPNTTILCNNKSVFVTKAVFNNSYGTSTFHFDFSPVDPSCVSVSVFKTYSAGNIATKIESRGYNDGLSTGSACASANLRRVERAILVNY